MTIIIFVDEENDFISSSLQTKNWRKNQKWYINGKCNECEKYQVKLVEKIINMKCLKSNKRINMEDKNIYKNLNPLKENNGFEYTENFDGEIIILNITYYFNFKFICDNGGAQTRSLREVYHFIKHQFYYLKKYKNDVYFINILDGDTCYKQKNKFFYLQNKFKTLKNKIFIGDMNEFSNWWKNK